MTILYFYILPFLILVIFSITIIIVVEHKKDKILKHYTCWEVDNLFELLSYILVLSFVPVINLIVLISILAICVFIGIKELSDLIKDKLYKWIKK